MWFNDPKFKLARRELISQLTKFNSSKNLDYSRKSYFGREPLPKIIFVCGGDPAVNPNRQKLEDYFKKHSKDNLTFRAEYAWETIVESKSTINALELEDWLADFSDVVIILVESFGTVAELGAFSMGEHLRKKLLPILDKKYKNDESFINTGPVRWVNNESKFAPCIYADFSSILTSMPAILDRVDVKRPKNYVSRTEDKTYGELRFSRKEMLFLVVLVIISIGPLNEFNIVSICKEAFGVKGKKELEEIKFIITLAVALGMIRKRISHNEIYYFCNDYSSLKNNVSVNALLAFSQAIRARCLSHLIYIKNYMNFLSEVDSLDNGIDSK